MRDYVFTVLVSCSHCNPNGSGNPEEGNIPRTDYQGRGEMSGPCIKRKLRNRLQQLGESIFVQADEYSSDGCQSLSERAGNNVDMAKALKAKDRKAYTEAALASYIDVRLFGQVFAFKGESKVTAHVRGCCSIGSAFSVDPVITEQLYITKSVNGSDQKSRADESEVASDRIGKINRINYGLYVIKGSISGFWADKNGLTEHDIEIVKESLRTLLENDFSTARPAGSMDIVAFRWIKNVKPSVMSTSDLLSDCIRIKPLMSPATSVEDYKNRIEWAEFDDLVEDTLYLNY